VSDNVKQFKCARCDCALEGPPNPQPHDRVACPTCGEGDTFENVMREAQVSMQEQLAQHFGKALIDGARGSKHVKVTYDFKPKGGHRFVVDLDLH
jgi:hypothetical protein